MFTECPECSIKFRVTAKVLQQAGGRVRCGGCGNAFSALDHLTEELPPSTIEPAADDMTSHEKFKETSRQLLKTLNDLAGPEDVVIEDTGMEWRVLDEDDEEAAPEEDSEESQQSLTLAYDADDSSVELSYDDETPLSDDEEIAHTEDDEGIAAEAGIDQLEEDVAANAAPTDAVTLEISEDADEEQAGIAVSEDEDWTDLLEEDAEDDAAADDVPLEVEEELAAIHNELSAKDDPDPVDLDSQFEMAAEAMGIDITGSQEIANDEEIEGEDEETVVADAEDDDPSGAGPLDEDEADEIEADDAEREPTGEFEAKIDVAAKAFEDGEEIEIPGDTGTKEVVVEAAPQEAEEVELAEVIELSLQDSDDDAADDDAADEPEHITVGGMVELEHAAGDDVPEQSDEEMTINQQIDQELMAAAAQDQDLKATIIGLEDHPADVFDENIQDVETIIMEGDVVRGAMEREREKERKERALARFDNAGNLIDSYIANRAKRGGRRAGDPIGWGMIGTAALLILMLVGQGLHAYRQELSTSELFNQTFGVLYRVFGSPVTPEWDIKGWQFEVTNGSVAEGENVLTISSRIGNRSEQPLPYPLVHVSLTDRWEEIIGSRVLEPDEYLVGNLDPSTPVVPGDNFTAIITLDEPSVDATGFKLNVCYRVSPGRVRCATEDFKD